jgi:hypothetical protein
VDRSVRLLPGFPAAEGAAADTLARLTDPVSLSLVGGSQVSQVIRRMTEGPRFADVGANEHRMARLMELWMAVQTAARTYEGVVAGAWAEANRRFVAQADHIIPPPTSRALDGRLGTTDYTELGLPGGHIGMFVTTKSQGIVGKGTVDWLVERDS